MVAIGIALIVQRPQVGFGREIRIEREDAPRVHGRSRHVVRHGERGGQKGVVELVRMADMFECVDRFAMAGCSVDLSRPFATGNGGQTQTRPGRLADRGRSYQNPQRGSLRAGRSGAGRRLTWR